MRPIALFIFLMCCQGCYAISNLDPLLTLKAYSDEKREQQRFVDNANQKYDQLKTDYFNQKLVPGITQQRIQTLYGNPLQIKESPDGQTWLFRYGVWHKGKDKIYLQFNSDEKLVVATYEDIKPVRIDP